MIIVNDDKENTFINSLPISCRCCRHPCNSSKTRGPTDFASTHQSLFINHHHHYHSSSSSLSFIITFLLCPHLEGSHVWRMTSSTLPLSPPFLEVPPARTGQVWRRNRNYPLWPTSTHEKRTENHQYRKQNKLKPTTSGKSSRETEAREEVKIEICSVNCNSVSRRFSRADKIAEQSDESDCIKEISSVTHF